MRVCVCGVCMSPCILVGCASHSFICHTDTYMYMHSLSDWFSLLEDKVNCIMVSKMGLKLDTEVSMMLPGRVVCVCVCVCVCVYVCVCVCVCVRVCVCVCVCVCTAPICEGYSLFPVRRASDPKITLSWLCNEAFVILTHDYVGQAVVAAEEAEHLTLREQQGNYSSNNESSLMHR